MKGRMLTVFVVLAMATAACAEPGVVGGDDVNQESESVTNDAVSNDPAASDEGAANDPGAVSDEALTSEEVSGQETAPESGDQTTPPLATVTTVPKTTPTTTAAAASDPEGTVPSSVANSDFVGKAKADLADRLNIAPDAIAVVSVQEVDWPDRSIGCPQPDMAYAQVITNGSRIILSHNGIAYHYHSAGIGDPFYCANPADPVPGSEV